MNFKGPLIEATLLRRNFRFLVDVALKNRRRRMLYFPNLGSLMNCDVLGSRLWFSSVNRLSQGYLDVVELIEVNGGWFVAINPGYGAILAREALEEGVVGELKGFRFVHFGSMTNTQPPAVELLLNEAGTQCFVQVEPVFFGDERGEGYFPETGTQSLFALQELIRHKEQGHRAVLLYCVQHNGIQCVRPRDAVHPAYGNLLRHAVKMGVEVLAYRVSINLRDMHLDARIPVLLSEDIVSN